MRTTNVGYGIGHGPAAVGEDGQDAERSCSMPLGAEPAGIGAARAFTRRWLNRWGLGESTPFGEDAVLVVSELVTNAVRHAEAAEALRLRWQPPTLIIEVQDRGSGMPRVCDPGDDQPGGRGLSIVTRLVQRCQVLLGAPGRKTIRVEMSLLAAEPGR